MASAVEKSAASNNVTTPSTTFEESSIRSDVASNLEKSILRKFDLYVLPQFMILVLVAYIDRSNIGPYSSSSSVHNT